MNILKGTMLFAGLMLVTSSAFAQRDPCGDQETQSGITQCAAKKLSSADDKLNASYSALIKKLKRDSVAVNLLRVSERAWVDYRKKQCDLVSYPTTGGSVQPMITHECWTSWTEERVKFLQDELRCEDGDLTCLRAGR